MRLTILNLAYRMYKKPIGFLYRGKNRKLKPIGQNQLIAIKEDLEREEQNMLWLRHPYLTMEQEHGCSTRDKAERFAKQKYAWAAARAAKFVKPKLITDRLKCLMVSDKWE